MKGKSLIGVILAAICVTVTYLLPGSEELSHEGITALGVLGMASILWISNTLPFGVTGLLALVMLVLLGVSDMASVFVGFSNSSVIFVITVFCLTAAVMNTKLTLRLINKLLRWAGSSAEKLVLAYMAAAALLSSVMSNVPVTVLFLGLAQPVLKAVGAKPGSSRLGKCLMIGIPFAAVNGGMATPAGSSFNVLAMGVFESIAGKPLTFLQWMAVGLPTAIVATLVCWICLVKIASCDTIVCVGNGVKDESLPKYKELAKLLGGKLAGTRPVCDRELLPVKLQVGQSGVMIKPKLYIGFGVSGAVNHVTGVDAEKFIAVNKDASAPIFNYCDYGIVGDMDEVCDAMIAMLKN